MKFSEITENEFESFVSTYEKQNFWQSKYMKSFQQGNNFTTYYVGVKENNTIKAASLLVFHPVKFGLFSIDAPRGFCLDYNDKKLLSFFSKEIKLFCKKRKGMILNVDPYFTLIDRDINGEIIENGKDNREVVSFLKNLGFVHEGYTKGYSTHGEPRWIYCLNTKHKTKEQIQQNFYRKSVKSYINLAHRKGVEIRDLSYDEIDVFYHMLEHTGVKHSFEARNIEYYQRLYKSFEPVIKFKVAEIHTKKLMKSSIDNLSDLQEKLAKVQEKLDVNPEQPKNIKAKNKILSDIKAEEKNIEDVQIMQKEHGDIIPASTGVFIVYGKEVLYLFGANYDCFMKYKSSIALQWDMISYAIENDYDRYNFYGISGLFNPDDEGYGVYRFKKGFGGYVEELSGNFSMVLTPLYYVYNFIKKLKF